MVQKGLLPQLNVPWVVLLMLLCIVPAHAVDTPWALRAPSVLRFSGVIENGKSIDLSANLRLGLEGPAGKNANFSANFSEAVPPGHEDLVNVHVLPINSFTLTESELHVDHTADIAVNLKNQTVPGTYIGSVVLSLVGQKAKPVTVTIVVVIQEVPKLALLNKPDTALLTNCQSYCALTDWLVPGSTRRELHFSIRNDSAFPIRVSASGIWHARQESEGTGVKGTTGLIHMTDCAPDTPGPSDQAQTTRADAAPSTPPPEPGAGVGSGQKKANSASSKRNCNEIDSRGMKNFTFTVDRERFPPDHYKGDAAIQVTGLDQVATKVDADQPVRPSNTASDTLSLSFDIRDNAMLPLVLVFVGVLLGLVFSWLRSPSVAARLTLYRQTEVLRQQIRNLGDPLVQSQLDQEIDALWVGLDTGAVTLQSFQDSMTDIAKKLQLLISQQRMHVRTTEMLTAQKVDSQTANAIDQQLDRSRRLLMNPGVDVQGLKAFDSASQMFTQARGGTVDPKATTEQLHEQRNAARNSPGRKFAAFFGIDTLEQTALAYKILRPLFYFLFVFAVGLSGAFSQYASDAHSTFGASWLDYLSISLWGFGSQVLGATFKDIQSLK